MEFSTFYFHNFISETNCFIFLLKLYICWSNVCFNRRTHLRWQPRTPWSNQLLMRDSTPPFDVLIPGLMGPPAIVHLKFIYSLESKPLFFPKRSHKLITYIVPDFQWQFCTETSTHNLTYEIICQEATPVISMSRQWGGDRSIIGNCSLFLYSVHASGDGNPSMPCTRISKSCERKPLIYSMWQHWWWSNSICRCFVVSAGALSHLERL